MSIEGDDVLRAPPLNARRMAVGVTTTNAALRANEKREGTAARLGVFEYLRERGLARFARSDASLNFAARSLASWRWRPRASSRADDLAFGSYGWGSPSGRNGRNFRTLSSGRTSRGVVSGGR